MKAVVSAHLHVNTVLSYTKEGGVSIFRDGC